MTLCQINCIANELHRLSSKEQRLSLDEAKKAGRKRSAASLAKQRDEVRRLRERMTGKSDAQSVWHGGQNR